MYGTSVFQKCDKNRKLACLFIAMWLFLYSVMGSQGISQQLITLHFNLWNILRSKVERVQGVSLINSESWSICHAASLLCLSPTRIPERFTLAESQRLSPELLLLLLKLGGRVRLVS